MTELNPIGQVLPGLSNTASGDAAAAATGLADNFDTFLVLLTEQLQNQDPLNPMDSQQFVEQLVQFSSVEQEIATNQSLETILALQTANARMSATDYLGKEVTVSTPQSVLENGSAQWTYVMPRQAASSELMITDQSGRVVATLAGESAEGTSSLTWDGRDAVGNQAPDGIYNLTVVAQDAQGEALDVPVRITRSVTGVDMSSDNVVVEMGTLTASAGSVIAVREPDGS